LFPPLVAAGVVEPASRSADKLIEVSLAQAIVVGALLVVATLIGTASAGQVSPAFTPCDPDDSSTDDPWYGDVLDEDAPGSGAAVVLTFSTHPSFSNSSTIAVIKAGNGYLLRLVAYRNMYATRTDQIGPDTFQGNVRTTRYDKRIWTTTLGKQFATGLQDLIQREIAQATPENARYGFDGTGYYIYTVQGCAKTWSPDANTRAGRIVAMFEDLEVQAQIPTRVAQGLWEEIGYQRLRALNAENTPMTPAQYFYVLLSLALVVAMAAFPLLVAIVVALVPRKLKAAWKFVLTSGAMAYGVTCLIALVFLPFWFGGAFLSVNLDIDGEALLADIVHIITGSTVALLFVVWIVSSVVVPVVIRRRGWPRPATTGQRSGLPLPS
jgi:hypothetical protein